MAWTINALLRDCRNHRWPIRVYHENTQADLHLQDSEVRRNKALFPRKYRPGNHQKIIARMRRPVATAARMERRASTEVWCANRAERTRVLSATATLLQPFWLHCQQTEYRLQFAETNG